MAQTDITDKDAEYVDFLQTTYRNALEYARPHLEIAGKVQNAYNADVMEGDWVTWSEIFFPVLRSAVEYIMPYVMKYMFPKDGFIELTPENPNVTYEQVRNLERFLEDLLLNKMNIKREGMLTLKDAVKYGFGYGIVEPKIITTGEAVDAIGLAGGKVASSSRVMKVATPKKTIGYRYIPFSQVIPTPDGDTPDDVTCLFYLDFIREDTLKQMYAEEQLLDPKDRKLKGNVDEIVKTTRDSKLDGDSYALWWIQDVIAGNETSISRFKNTNSIMTRHGHDKAPVRVPIMKCYQKNRHTWVANGDTIIYDVEDEFQTLRCPVVKATANPDSASWYAQSDVSASRDVANAVVITKNAVMDLLTNYLRPTKVVNMDYLGSPSQLDNISPNGVVQTRGAPNVNNAVSYMTPPPLPNGLMNIGGMLEQDHAQATGKSLQLEGQGTAGMMRGGSGAFESLLQTMNARQELMTATFEIDWLVPVLNNVLALLQSMDGEQEAVLRDDENKEFKSIKLTQDDIRNSFGIRLNLDAKNTSPADQQWFMQVYNLAIRGNVEFDQTAPLEDIVGADKVRRWKATPEQKEENIRMAQLAQMAQGQAGQTKGEQAAMGGAAQQRGKV